jgi:DNA polymerase-1
MHERVEKRLFLVDGYGFVFRAYHSMPPLTSPAGVPVGAVYGFTNMLLKLKNKVRTANAEQAYIVCVFDAGKKTFRNEIYSEYKAHRPPAPDDLIPQFPIVREVAAALNIPTIELEGFEADDIIATYTKLAQEQGVHVTIVSGDKDLMQLVNEDVKMYDSLRERIIGIDQVKEKFGVAPGKVLDLLSLMGDSSDNIPGVPSVGPKTAAELINTYGDLDAIYENIEKITKKKLKENLTNFKQDAYISRQLVSLKYDVAVESDIHKFAVQPDDINILAPFLEKYGFKSLLAKVNSSGISSIKNANNSFPIHKTAGVRASEAEGKRGNVENNWIDSSASSSSNHANQVHESQIIEPTVTQISNRAEFASWLPPLNECRKLAINIIITNKTKQNPESETTITIAKSSHEECLLVASEEEVFHRVSTDNQNDLFSATNSDKVKTYTPYFQVLKPYVESGSCNIIFADLKSALHNKQLNIALPKAFDDASIMNYVVNGTTKKLELSEDFQATQIFNLHTNLEQQIFDNKLNYIYHQVEKPLIVILASMEDEGIKVDKNILANLSAEFNAQLKRLESEVFALAGEEFNIGSPKQLGEVLFDHMGIAGGKKSKTGNYTTDSDVLETLEEQGHSIAGKVLEWRSFSKLINTYTESLVDYIDATGRVHTHFNQASTTTGRLSSSDPNIQNIPIRTEEGRKIRAAFIAEKGKKLIGIDYSQIELRLLAHVANIDVLKEAFKNGKDIHAATAAQVFGVDINNVDSELRRRAKTINFGIIYGQSAFGLAKQLGIARGEAKELIDKYFLQYPGIKRYMDETIMQAREQGYVSTIWGRKIHLPGINDKNGMIRSFNERAAINAPLQGTAADIIKRAMIVIESKINEAKLLLQIHDELIFECDEASAEKHAEKIKSVMENVINLSVPLIADAKIGNSWSEIH